MGCLAESPKVLRGGFTQTLLPVILHCFGVGLSVVLRVYYDLSPKIGHIEGMYLIIR
jgi:hypothetical protein